MSYVDTRKWVVYLKPLGSTKIGVYKRHVTLGEKCAFIHPKEDGRRADLLPLESVFTEERAAKDYFAGQGLRRWVVDPGSTRSARPCELFEAFVHYGAFGRHGHNKVFKRCDDKEIPKDTYPHCFEVYTTKKEALPFFRAHRNEQKKEALAAKAEAEAMLAALKKVAKESR